MGLRYLLFDLDETLYTDTSGLFQEVGARIEAWLARTLHLSPEEARALRRRHFQTYGSTMMGLLHEHPGVDIEDYLEAVHRVPVEQYLVPTPELDAMLNRLPLTKVIFTNSTVAWTERVLQALGVRHHFARIIDVHAVAFHGKPAPVAFRRALALLGASGPECIFVDDQARNLRVAATFGIHTILVRAGAQVEEGIEAAVARIVEIEPVVLRWLEMER